MLTSLLKGCEYMLERLFISYRNIDDSSINIDEFNLEDETKYTALLIQAFQFTPKGLDEEDVMADYAKTLRQITTAYKKIKEAKTAIAMLQNSDFDDSTLAPIIASAKAEIKKIYYRMSDLHMLESTKEFQNMKERYEKRLLSTPPSSYPQTSTYVRRPTPQYEPTNPISSQSLWETKTYHSTKNKSFPFSKKTIVIALSVFIVFVLIIALASNSNQNTTASNNGQNTSTNNSSNNESSTTKPQLTPITEPRSGTILSGSTFYNGSELTIRASGGHSCVVKLKTASGVTRLSFYVRAGDTVTVNVPSEYLYVYFATGDTWYGSNHLFGDETSYSMDDDIQNFIDYTVEYTLYPVTYGNFTETPISADEFN